MSSTTARPVGLSWQLIILLASLSAIIATAIDMYLPAFPAVGASFGITAGQVQQTLTVFLLGLGVGQGIYGPLLDRYGRRIPLLVGLTVFTVSSAFAAITSSFEGLLIARFCQAIGAAAGAVIPRTVVADTCDVKDSARIFSMLMQIMMIAPITAPLIGGLILRFGEWHSIFWSLAIVGLLCLAFSWRLLPETLPPERRLPLQLSSLLESYSKLLGNPKFLLFTLATGCTLGALFSYISNSPFVFISYFDYTPEQFSYLFAVNAGVMILISQINLRLLKIMQVHRIFYLGICLLIMLSVTLLISSYWLSISAIWYAVLLGLAMAMLGLITGNLTALTMAQAGKHAGIASSLMGMMQFIIAGLIGFGVSWLPQNLSTLPLALSLCGGLALLFGWCALHFPDRAKQ